MTIENDNGTPRINGLAAMTVFEHEYEMGKQRRNYKKILAATVSALIGSNLAWIILSKKH